MPWHWTGSSGSFAWVEGGTGKVVDGALDGTIIVAQGKVAIFISHTCVCRF